MKIPSIMRDVSPRDKISNCTYFSRKFL